MRKDRKNILYHFTTAISADQIKKSGLQLGRTPIMNDGKIKFLAKTQWLTINRNPDQQAWATKGRTQAVIKVNIPKPLAKERLIPFQAFYSELKDRLPEGFNDIPWITEDWYVFIGIIPPQWIVSVRKFTGERVGGNEKEAYDA